MLASSHFRWTLLLILVDAGALCAQDAYTDYDRRAARALYNTLKPGSVADKKLADPSKLDQPPRKDGSKVVYTINLPGQGGGSMFSGYYRISVNTDLVDAAAGGWTVLGRDPETGADLFFKKVQETTAEKHNDVAARKKIGNVILTVAQRRPFDEDPKIGAADMVKRFKALLANARDNQLFASVALKLTGGDPPREPTDAGSEPLLLNASPGRDLKLFYVAQVVDADNKPIPGVKRLKLRLAGPLTQFGSLECKQAKDVGGKALEIVNPREKEEFTLVIRGSDPALAEALFNLAAQNEESPEPPIGVKVTAEFK